MTPGTRISEISSTRIYIHQSAASCYLTLLLLLRHCNLCCCLQQFSHFLVLFLSILPQALRTTDCLSNWHPVLSTFFPCLLLFHFLVLPVLYILSHIHPSPRYKFCPRRFLLSVWAKCGLSQMELIYDVLVLRSLHSSYLSLMSYNKISQSWPQIIWSWKIFSLFPNQKWKFNHDYLNSIYIVHL